MKKLPKKFYIDTFGQPELARAVILRMFQTLPIIPVGFGTPSNRKKVEDNTKTSYCRYVGYDAGNITHSPDILIYFNMGYVSVSLSEFFELTEKQKLTLKINNDYTIAITPEGVETPDVMFSWEKVDELIAAVRKNKVDLKDIVIAVQTNKEKQAAGQLLSDICEIPNEINMWSSLTQHIDYVGITQNGDLYVITAWHNVPKERKVYYFKDIPALLLDYYKTHESVVRLTDSYSAEINRADKTIKIGCQTFKFEILDEIMKLKNNIKE